MNLIEILSKRNLLSEGIEDPAKLKAVFMAGGPGSGKSHIAKEIFNVPTDFPLSSYGLKVINTDYEFEYLLKKEGRSLDLSSLSSEDFKKLTVGPQSLRSKAKDLTKKKFDSYKNSRIGLLIDGTGDTINNIQEKRYLTTLYGYDTFMIFVNTSIEVALERNRKRSRKLPNDLVKQIWSSCQNNMGHFQSIFGNNFRIVDNSTTEKNHKDVVRTVIKFLNQPIQNPIGKSWVSNYYKLKNTLSDRPSLDLDHDDDDEENQFDIKTDPMSSKSLVSKKIDKSKK